MDSAFSPNLLAIFFAALSTFLMGGLWYSPKVFGNSWIRLNGFGPEHLAARKMGQVFGLSFALALFSALILAYFIGPQPDVGFAALAGLLVGGWVAASFGVTYLFEGKPARLFLINAGYHLVTFTLMGLIIAIMGKS